LHSSRERVFKKLSQAIPTDDPVEALQFCRVLVAAIQSTEEALPSSVTRSHDAARFPGLDRQEAFGDHSSQSSPSLSELRPELSVVLPVFNEEKNLAPTYERLKAVLQEQGNSYELIFVDDGSNDRSLKILLDFAAQDRNVKIIQLARNFGHQIAVTAGLDYARGDGVIIMDTDLQDPPEVLPQFIAKWREGSDVVFAIREERKENLAKRMAYATFYRLLRKIARIDIPLNAGDFCIMDRKVVNLLRAMPERNRFVRGLRSWVGLRQVGLPYKRQARHSGRPKYSISHLTLLALDGFISFSQMPLRLASLLGFSISFLSFFLALFYIIQRLVTGITSQSSGFSTLIVAILFLAGIQLVTIGVMGEYIGRIFDEVKQRPLYIVRLVIGY
jgi:polyisoprenyl-phosphate glycosyltransferase